MISRGRTSAHGQAAKDVSSALVRGRRHVTLGFARLQLLALTANASASVTLDALAATTATAVTTKVIVTTTTDSTKKSITNHNDTSK